jgi:hypothetical protein
MYFVENWCILDGSIFKRNRYFVHSILGWRSFHKMIYELFCKLSVHKINMNTRRIGQLIYSFGDNDRFREVSRTYKDVVDTFFRGVELTDRKFRSYIINGDEQGVKYFMSKGFTLNLDSRDSSNDFEYFKSVMIYGSDKAINLLCRSIGRVKNFYILSYIRNQTYHIQQYLRRRSKWDSWITIDIRLFSVEDFEILATNLLKNHNRISDDWYLMWRESLMETVFDSKTPFEYLSLTGLILSLSATPTKSILFDYITPNLTNKLESVIIRDEIDVCRCVNTINQFVNDLPIVELHRCVVSLKIRSDAQHIIIEFDNHVIYGDLDEFKSPNLDEFKSPNLDSFKSPSLDEFVENLETEFINPFTDSIYYIQHKFIQLVVEKMLRE